ncbi:MAG: helix-turn-helix domain-containing protein [Firmicutes bacterium]|nr:helix-turn-helix domain-containing protein [Bacillota bacterium]
MITENKRQVHIEQVESDTVLKDKRKRGWFWDNNEVFDSDLSKNAILVRLYIAKCANGDRQAWPSLNTIAKHCKVSKPTVIKALKELEEKGWLQKIIRRQTNDEYVSTVYILKDPPETSEASIPFKKGGSKTVLPPVKNEVSEEKAATKGVVNSFNHPVKQVDNLVKQFDPNKTQGIRPSEQDKNNKLLISSLRSDINNSAVNFQSTDTVVGDDYEKLDTPNQCDSHPQAGAADTAVNQKNEVAPMPNNKELISLLVKEYRAIEDIQGSEGDYAFIGAVFNKYGYDRVLEAIYELSVAAIAQEIRKPLLYLKGILENSDRNNARNNSGDRKMKHQKPKVQDEIVIDYKGQKYSEVEFLAMHRDGRISEEDFLAHAPEKTFIKSMY